MPVASAAYPNILLMTLLVTQAVVCASKPSQDYVEMPVDESLNENEKKHAPRILKVSDDAMETKQNALADTGIAGAKIKCTVCEQASVNISGTLATRDFRNEFELIEYFSAFCGFGGFPEHLVKGKHWQLTEKSKGEYALEPPTEEEAKAAAAAAVAAAKEGDTDWDVVKASKAVTIACEATVKESHSELAEFLFTSRKGRTSTAAESANKGMFKAASAISKKLCMELSGACKKSKSKKRKGRGKKEL